jgi:hypothetical protein
MANVPVNSQDLRVALEICDMIQGPMEPTDVAKVVRMAAYLTPMLEEAFETQGINPDDVDLPEFPLLKPGDLYKG